MSTFSFGHKESLIDQAIYFFWNCAYFYSRIKANSNNLFFTITKICALKSREFMRYYNIAKNEKFQCNSDRELFYSNLRPMSQEAIQLLKEGYVDPGLSFDSIAKEVVEIVRHSPCYDSQVPIQAFNFINFLNPESRTKNYFSLVPNNEKLIPFYQKVLSDERLKYFISDYFGEKTFLYSINTMRSFPPINGVSHDVTKIHRDFDDIGFLSLFVYWTPVSATGGTTRIVPNSHRNPDHFYDEISNSLIGLEGGAGKAWLVDPYVLHCGSSPIEGERIVTWFRFSRVQSNLASYQDKSKFFSPLFEELWTN